MMIAIRASSRRRFLVIWWAQLLSRMGSGMSAFALGVHVFRETSSAAAYSVLLLAAFLPSVVLAPVGGVLADRHDRRILMAGGDLGAALGIVGVLAALAIAPGDRLLVLTAVALSSTFVALHGPAFEASITDLLDEREYERASGLVQLAEASRYVLAPLAAVTLLGHVSLRVVLWIDALTFVVAAVVALACGPGQRCTTSAREDVGFVASLRFGIACVRERASLRRLVTLACVVTFLVGVLQALIAPLVLSFASDAAFGRMQSIAATGMLGSSVWIGVANVRADHRRLLPWMLVVAGLFTSAIGLATNMVAVTAAAFGLFCTLPWINTSLEVLLRRDVESGLQGRVWSLVSFASQSAMLVAFAAAGVLADRVCGPLLAHGGRLTGVLDAVFGADATRGSALLVVLAGVAMTVHALGLARRSRLASLPSTCQSR